MAIETNLPKETLDQRYQMSTMEYKKFNELRVMLKEQKGRVWGGNCNNLHKHRHNLPIWGYRRYGAADIIELWASLKNDTTE